MLYPSLSFRNSAWTPEIISPALWLDANDSSTLTLVSGAVSEWRDKSGNNRHATQATASNRPLLVTGGLNGTDVIRFGNTDLNVSDLILTGSSAECFAIFNMQNTSKTYARLLSLRQVGQSVDWDNPASWVPLSRHITTNFVRSELNNTGSGIIEIALSTYYLLNSRVNNNISVTLNATTTVSSTSITVNLNTTEGMRIGNSLMNSSDFWYGDISQIIMFNRTLTQAEREQMEGYLAWSTGLQGNLPTNHPYKNQAP